MEKVMKFYMDKGVAGFRLDAVSFEFPNESFLIRLEKIPQINHMFEDDQFRDEARNPDVPDENNYDHLWHNHVSWSQNAN